MALPTTRDEFKKYCLRRLGAPVVQIHVTEEQIDDRVNDAIQYFNDYHYDGSVKEYYKHVWTANNFPDRVSELYILDGGRLYSNTDTLTLTNPTSGGETATANIVTNSNGTITALNLITNGKHYRAAPTPQVTTSTGSGARIEAFLGGYIPLPNGIIGAVNIFDVGTSFSNDGLFNVRYQLTVNELYNFANFSLVPYYMAMQHIQLIQEILVGKQPLRYNRHNNRLYVDMDYSRVKIGQYLIAEVYRSIDPDNSQGSIWSDRWLLRYATALIKKQNGESLKKHKNVAMVGGVMFSGQEIWDEAVREIEELEDEMMISYSLPVMDMIG